MLSLVRSDLLNRGISEGASGIILASWRYGKQKQYHTYLRLEKFCCWRKMIQFVQLWNGIEFLSTEYQRGLPYTGLNTIRSLISIVSFPHDQSFGSHPLDSRYLIGVF